MRLSSHLHSTITAEGWRALYSPFGHNVAFLYDEAWELLEQGNVTQVNPKIVDYLIQNNFLVEKGFEAAWIKDNLIEPQVRLNSMYLVVTQNCNFGCKYCAVVENFDSASRLTEKMSLATGRQAVEFFQRQLEKSRPIDARVTFYGGEPMLNQELLFDLVPLIRDIQYSSQEKSVEIIMITNGYLYNQELTDLFSKHGVGVCISLDGTKNIRILHG